MLLLDEELWIPLSMHLSDSLFMLGPLLPPRPIQVRGIAMSAREGEGPFGKGDRVLSLLSLLAFLRMPLRSVVDSLFFE